MQLSRKSYFSTVPYITFIIKSKVSAKDSVLQEKKIRLSESISSASLDEMSNDKCILIITQDDSSLTRRVR